MPGTLVLCATPIGNLSDAPPRLREALAAADVVYCEDTRRSGKLVAALGLKVRLRSYFVANEDARAVELAEHLEAGKTVALITDAGMPAVADPGLTAVLAAVEVGATVTVVPGPSAVTAAVAVSGLPSERFMFEGFLPRKQEQRAPGWRSWRTSPARWCFSSPPPGRRTSWRPSPKCAGTNRPVVVARELTKLHEEVWRGTIAAAAAHYADNPPKGELTVVVAGAPELAGDLEAAVALVRRFVTEGVLFSEAVKRAADAHGVRRRLLYEAARRRLDSDAGS